MDYVTVLQRLDDLPRTFRRFDPSYIAWDNSLAAGLTLGTLGADGEVAQIEPWTITTSVTGVAGQSTISTLAQFGWLDVWGLLFGIPRQINEADAHYVTRIAYTVKAGAGPPVAIARWIKIVWGLNATVQENFPGVGYSITLPGGLTQTQLVNIVLSLARIRPAGVPFSIVAGGGGLYLDTINFMDTPDVTGGFLTDGSLASLGIGPGTDNSVPLLPTTMLTDPTLNGTA